MTTNLTFPPPAIRDADEQYYYDVLGRAWSNPNQHHSEQGWTTGSWVRVPVGGPR